jgi:hypothetical protein
MLYTKLGKRWLSNWRKGISRVIITKIQLFGNKRIRTAWDEEEQEWYPPLVDVVSVLIRQSTSWSASTYWAVKKNVLLKKALNCLQIVSSPKIETHSRANSPAIAGNSSA